MIREIQLGYRLKQGILESTPKRVCIIVDKQEWHG
jgi:hypothetical protein